MIKLILSSLLIISVSYLCVVDLRLLTDDKLSPPIGSVVKFYDIFGGILMNSFYHSTFEEKAMDQMIMNCGFDKSDKIVEIGPGSGFLASKILRSFQDDNFNGLYIGVDLSQKMIEKASLEQKDLIEKGSLHLYHVNDTIDFLGSYFPANDVDKIVFTYVLDLLPRSEIMRFVELIKNKLNNDDSRLCIVNLTYGFDPLTRLVSNVWQLLFRLLGGDSVGGCRPINSLDYFNTNTGYNVQSFGKVQSSGLPSEVVILSASNPTPTNTAQAY